MKLGVHVRLAIFKKGDSLKKLRRDSRLMLLYKGVKSEAYVPTDDLIPLVRRCRNHHSLAYHDVPTDRFWTRETTERKVLGRMQPKPAPGRERRWWSKKITKTKKSCLFICCCCLFFFRSSEGSKYYFCRKNHVFDIGGRSWLVKNYSNTGCKVGTLRPLVISAPSHFLTGSAVITHDVV